MKYLFLLLLLAGCGHTPEVIVQTERVFIDVQCEELPHILPIEPLPVIFVQGVTTDGYQVLGLRGDQYSNLAINSADIIRYIQGQKASIEYYKKCIANHNAAQNAEREP